MYTLEILAENDEIKEYYKSRQNYSEDSGIDLYVTENYKIKPIGTFFIDHHIKCRLVDESGKTFPYYLYPRSSISKTPLMMANSVGIIDKNYRGSIIGAVKYVFSNNDIFEILTHEEESDLPSYHLKKDTRLFQICAPDLSPLQVKLVDTLDETSRGTGGFGSTGN